MTNSLTLQLNDDLIRLQRLASVMRSLALSENPKLRANEKALYESLSWEHEWRLARIVASLRSADKYIEPPEDSNASLPR